MELGYAVINESWSGSENLASLLAYDSDAQSLESCSSRNLAFSAQSLDTVLVSLVELDAKIKMFQAGEILLEIEEVYAELETRFQQHYSMVSHLEGQTHHHQRHLKRLMESTQGVSSRFAGIEAEVAGLQSLLYPRVQEHLQIPTQPRLDLTTSTLTQEDVQISNKIRGKKRDLSHVIVLILLLLLMLLTHIH